MPYDFKIIRLCYLKVLRLLMKVTRYNELVSGFISKLPNPQRSQYKQQRNRHHHRAGF